MVFPLRSALHDFLFFPHGIFSLGRPLYFLIFPPGPKVIFIIHVTFTRKKFSNSARTKRSEIYEDFGNHMCRYRVLRFVHFHIDS